ncbi:MAG: GDSL-type esterase/lipase family protein [Bacteroidales bacterium]|nr:GDSL-type esterase/lipase family protein [Bacteroidales bacterium]
MNCFIKYICSLLLLFGFTKNLFSQDYPYDITKYNFIRYDFNKIKFSKDSSAYLKLYQKLDSLILFGKGNLSVVQLGASHTQADIFSNQMRFRLQTMHPGLIGGRGFVFPYRMCKTNNPSNYSVEYSGFWTSCRNVEYKRSCDLGISGVSATTLSSDACIRVIMNPKNPIKYDCNQVKIFVEPGLGQFDILPEAYMGNYTVNKDYENGVIEYKFDTYFSNVAFHLCKTDSIQNHFTFYGLSLENDNSGITYHSIGINGASIPSWLKCKYFSKQLSFLKPDWIIIYLGVNDANTYSFKEDVYYNNYIELISEIKRCNPNVLFTFIVPNDFYLFRKRPNPAVEEEEVAINKLVTRYNASMYSIYDVMGGFGSSKIWLDHGLMSYDKVHMSVAGYTFSANLFFNAFLRTYDNYLEKKIKNN